MLIWRNFCKTFLGKNYHTVQLYQNFRENNKIKSPKIDLMKKWFERGIFWPKIYFVKSSKNVAFTKYVCQKRDSCVCVCVCGVYEIFASLENYFVKSILQ